MGKKTSVYLTDQMLEALHAQGRSLPEVIRTGLGMAPATAAPSRADLTAALREVVGSLAIPQQDPAPAQPQDPRLASPEQRLVGAIFGEDPNTVREAPKPHVVTETSEQLPVPRVTGKPRLPTLDRRIKESMNALVTEWAAGLDNEPDGYFTQRVEGQVRILLESGVVPADISRGLAQWQASDSSAVPELIPEIVHQLMEATE